MIETAAIIPNQDMTTKRPLQMTSTIRHATPSDLAAIQAISDKAYAVHVAAMGRKPGPMLADYPAHLAADVVLVATDGDGVVRGYAVILDQPDGFWLDNIAVDQAAQGQGIGGRLLAAVESWLRQRTGRYSLYTHVRMTANIAWYGRAGFTETGRRRVNGFDRVYFEKHFSQPKDK